MQKLFLLIALFISSIFLTFQSSAQTTGDGYLLITVYESLHPDFTKIIVTENGAKIQEIQLRSVVTKELEYNQIQVNNTLDKYKKAGYTLVSFSKGSTNIGPGSFGMITTYILEKK
jgi:hypothetical protein